MFWQISSSLFHIETCQINCPSGSATRRWLDVDDDSKNQSLTVRKLGIIDCSLTVLLQINLSLRGN